MTILIVGAGATGGLFGARLAAAGRDVTYLVRPDRAALLAERGLRITGPDGAAEVTRPRLATADELAGPYDVVLVTVKATALAPVIGEVGPAVGPGTAIVPVLNGMGHLSRLNAAFGPDRVLGGVALVSAQLDRDGGVVQLTDGASLKIGAQDGQRSPVVKRAAGELSRAGFAFGVSGDILAEMWAKWAFIASASAANCLLGGSVGEIAAVDGGERCVRAVVGEVQAVARAAGYRLARRSAASMTATLTAAGSPFTASLYRDLRAGRPVEVEPVLGDLVAVAREEGVPVPLLEAATVALRVQQARRAAGVSGLRGTPA
ncbi:MAG TPA: ketopantoate reductase family protein [Trebonia sp.]|nr:ketopantoate reductase family protein [Trebonia sp.]